MPSQESLAYTLAAFPSQMNLHKLNAIHSNEKDENNYTT